MTHIAEALGISRPHLSTTLNHPTKPKAPMLSGKDEALLARIRPIVDARPTCGYRRVTAHLNCDKKDDGVNHKRVYRVMELSGLLLPNFGPKPQRDHRGTIVTLASDIQSCSDMFEIRRWNGEKVHVEAEPDVGRADSTCSNVASHLFLAPFKDSADEKRASDE